MSLFIWQVANSNYDEKGKTIEVKEVRIKDEFIKLGQALKLAGEVSSGIDAKILIQDGEVSVNDEVEYRRGRKLYKDDIFCFQGKEFIIKN